MRSSRMAQIACAIALSSSVAACMGEAASDAETGSLGMELQIAPGVTLNTVSWSINNPLSAFARSGSVNVQFSNTLSFQTGALPPGAGYTITLSATSVDGAFSCTGSAGFRVASGIVTPVSILLTCAAVPPGGGSIIVNGTTQLCANLDSLSASPLETFVNTSIVLSATGSLGALPAHFAWTTTAGTFDDAASATPTFTCPATPGDVTITVAVSPGAPACPTVTSQSVTVTCSTPTPTFTNVYAGIISARCTVCHRPAGGGVTVGMLDMSTQALAYANLVGVAARGVGAGTSGVTCASLSPPAVRVVPGDAEHSLLFDKVHAKLAGAQPPCGSPMPLPATAAPLTAAQVDLITAWVNGGALND